MLHVVFTDVPGSLSAITSTLNDRGINVYRAVAFKTTDGVAVDFFLLSLFDRDSATVLKDRLCTLIATADKPLSNLSAMSSNAVTFTISMRSLFGSVGGGNYREQLVVADGWLAYGRHRIGASELYSVTTTGTTWSG